MRVKLDYARLRARCLARNTISGMKVSSCKLRKEYYVFKDNKAPVLFVAHLDTYAQASHFHVNRINGGQLIMAAQLDDRLGVHIGLDVLPRLGVNMDVLLTTNEERGQSTAEHFVPSKQYNWIVQFDRMHEDAVLYRYDRYGIENKWKKALEKAGFKIGTGSSSDISKMEGLKCKAVNIGCGYDNYHSVFATAWWPSAVGNIRKFVRFYRRYSDTYFPHEEYVYTPVVAAPARHVTHVPYHPVTPPATPATPTAHTLSMCPTCKVWVDKKQIDKQGVCDKCVVVQEALEQCTVGHHYVDSEEYSYRTGMCYQCLLSRY